MLRPLTSLCLGLAAGWVPATLGQIPGLLSHQGRLLVDAAAYEGTAAFKFALVDAGGSQVFWGNAPDGNADGEPDEAVELGVTRGLYSVLLGDVSIPRMAALPPEVFENGTVFLRVWVEAGTGVFHRLEPDQRVAAVGYAMVAATVPDGSIDAGKLAPGALADVQAEIEGLTQQVEALTAAVQALSGTANPAAIPGLTAVSSTPDDAALRALGFTVFNAVAAPGWVDGDGAGAPSARSGHVGVWTGEELLIWGGELAPGVVSGNGALYRPEPEGWRPLNPTDAPAARSGHTGVWTGDELLVWGGFAGGAFLGTGAAFSPSSQLWTTLPAGPEGRTGHVAVWTGARLMVWGGRNGGGLLGDGSLLDRAAGTWTALMLPGAPVARQDAVAVWAGDRVVLWGGEGDLGMLGDGTQLRFDGAGAPAEWVAMNPADAPSPRARHTAIWTGQRVMVWGGRGPAGEPLGDGAAYDPVANAWEPLPGEGAPAARMDHGAVWTGQEMIIFGGETAVGPTATGHAFDPATGKWRALSTAGDPLARAAATVVWTGSELVIFGGRNGSQPLAALERLVPQPTWYFYRKP